MTEDEMVGWHHRPPMNMSLSKLQELVMAMDCSTPWGHKESDTTKQLN